MWGTRIRKSKFTSQLVASYRILAEIHDYDIWNTTIVNVGVDGSERVTNWQVGQVGIHNMIVYNVELLDPRVVLQKVNGLVYILMNLPLNMMLLSNMTFSSSHLMNFIPIPIGRTGKSCTDNERSQACERV